MKLDLKPSVRFTKALSDMSKQMILTSHAFGQMAAQASMDHERDMARWRMIFMSEDDVRKIDLACRRLTYGSIASYSDWNRLQRAVLSRTHMGVNGVLDWLCEMTPEHVLWHRMEWETFAEWETYLFERGLIDRPDARMAYQKAVWGAPMRWLRRRLGR